MTAQYNARQKRQRRKAKLVRKQEAIQKAIAKAQESKR